MTGREWLKSVASATVRIDVVDCSTGILTINGPNSITEGETKTYTVTANCGGQNTVLPVTITDVGIPNTVGPSDYQITPQSAGVGESKRLRLFAKQDGQDESGLTEQVEITATYTPPAPASAISVSKTVTIVDAPSQNLLAVNDDHTLTSAELSAGQSGTGIELDVLHNDQKLPGTSIASATPAQHGEVVVHPGKIVYTPDTPYPNNPSNDGPVDQFTYTIYSGGDTSTANVYIYHPDSTGAKDDSYDIISNGFTRTLNVLANDTSSSGAKAITAVGSQGVPGSKVYPGKGTLTWTSNLMKFTTVVDASGIITLPYTLNGQSTANVTLNIRPEPSGILAVDDEGFVADFQQIGSLTILPSSNINVLVNDSGDGLQITDPPQGGYRDIYANGQLNVRLYNRATHLEYDPRDFGYAGPSPFDYTITDSYGNTDTATVTMYWKAIAEDDYYDVRIGENAIFEVLDNDLGQGLSITNVTPPTGPGIGTFTIIGSTITFAPNALATDNFELTYTIEDAYANTDSATVYVSVLPLAVDDEALIETGTTNWTSIYVLNNDKPAGGLILANYTEPSNGEVQKIGSYLQYKPDSSFVGTDTFEYTIYRNNGSGGSDTATVTVRVEEALVANDDAFMFLEDSVNNPIHTAALLANDDDQGREITLQVETLPSGGTLDTSNDPYLYTPPPNFAGVESFSYSITDGEFTDSATVALTVEAVNDLPIAVDDEYETSADEVLNVAPKGVLINDSDPDPTDVLTVIRINSLNSIGTPVPLPSTALVTLNADGSFTYDPNGAFDNLTGNDDPVDESFTYTISDGTDEATANVTITVTPVNDPPIAEDDAVTTTQGTAITIEVLKDNGHGPDHDPDGDTISVFEVVADPAHGSAVKIGDTIEYTPVGNFVGQDGFTYSIKDTYDLTDTATVTITVEQGPEFTIEAIDDEATEPDQFNCGNHEDYGVFEIDGPEDEDSDSFTIKIDARDSSHATPNSDYTVALWDNNAQTIIAGAVSVTDDDGDGIYIVTLPETRDLDFHLAIIPLVDADWELNEDVLMQVWWNNDQDHAEDTVTIEDPTEELLLSLGYDPAIEPLGGNPAVIGWYDVRSPEGKICGDINLDIIPSFPNDDATPPAPIPPVLQARLPDPVDYSLSYRYEYTDANNTVHTEVGPVELQAWDGSVFPAKPITIPEAHSPDLVEIVVRPNQDNETEGVEFVYAKLRDTGGAGVPLRILDEGETTISGEDGYEADTLFCGEEYDGLFIVDYVPPAQQQGNQQQQGQNGQQSTTAFFYLWGTADYGLANDYDIQGDGVNVISGVQFANGNTGAYGTFDLVPGNDNEMIIEVVSDQNEQEGDEWLVLDLYWQQPPLPLTLMAANQPPNGDIDGSLVIHDRQERLVIDASESVTPEYAPDNNAPLGEFTITPDPATVRYPHEYGNNGRPSPLQICHPFLFHIDARTSGVPTVGYPFAAPPNPATPPVDGLDTFNPLSGFPPPPIDYDISAKAQEDEDGGTLLAGGGLALTPHLSIPGVAWSEIDPQGPVERIVLEVDPRNDSVNAALFEGREHVRGRLPDFASEDDVIIFDELVEEETIPLRAKLDTDEKPDPDFLAGGFETKIGVDADTTLLTHDGVVVHGLGAVNPYLPQFRTSGNHNERPIFRVWLEAPSRREIGDDIIYHDVPSPQVVKAHLEYKGKKISDNIYVDTKDMLARIPGWIMFAIQVNEDALVDLEGAGADDTGVYQIDLHAVDARANDEGSGSTSMPDEKYARWYARYHYMMRDLVDDDRIATGWLFPYTDRLVKEKIKVLVEDPETGEVEEEEKEGVALFRGDNSASWWQLEEGLFRRPPESVSSLSETQNGYVLHSHYDGHTDYFDKSGRLSKRADPNGNFTIFTYEDGVLDRIDEPSGRIIDYDFDGGQLRSITEKVGKTSRAFMFDGQGDVLKVTLPDPDGPNKPLKSPVIEYSYDDGTLQSIKRSEKDGDTVQHTDLTYHELDDRVDRVIRYATVGEESSAVEHEVITHRLREGLPSWKEGVGEGTEDDPLQYLTEFSNITGYKKPKEVDDDAQAGTTIVMDNRGRALETTDSAGNVWQTYRGQYVVEQQDMYNELGLLDTVVTPPPEFPEGYDDEAARGPTCDEFQSCGAPDKLTTRFRYTYHADGAPSKTTVTLPNGLKQITVFDEDTGQVVKYTDELGNSVHSPIAGGDVNIDHRRWESKPIHPDVRSVLYATPWQNKINPLNVNPTSYKDNDEGSVTALDALLIINELNSVGSHKLDSEVSLGGPDKYLDVNGDEFVAPVDVVLVINYLNRNPLSADDRSRSTPSPDSTTVFDISSGRDPRIDYEYLPRSSANGLKGLLDRDITTTGRTHKVTTDYDYYEDHPRRFGQVHTVTHATGTVEYDYDAFGNVRLVKDERRNTTYYKYDALDRLIEIRSPDPDGPNKPEQAPVTTIEYDSLGNLVQETRVNYTYDFSSGSAVRTNENFHVTCHTYDGLNRLRTSVQLPGQSPAPLCSQIDIDSTNGAITRTDYDDHGNVIEVSDAGQRRTVYEYDALDRVEAVIEPHPTTPASDGTANAPTTRFEYDALGNTTIVTDQEGNVSEMYYDEMSRLLRTVQPDPYPTAEFPDKPWPTFKPTTEYKYYPTEFGWVEEVKDPRGAYTVTYRDVMGRVSAIGEPTGAGHSQPVTVYEYYADGLVRNIHAPGSTSHRTYRSTHFNYDADGRLWKEKTADGTTQYVYWPNDLLRETVDALDRRTTYVYDGLDRVTTVYLPDVDSGPGTDRPSRAYRYDTFGNILGEENERRQITFYSYDERNRLHSQTVPKRLSDASSAPSTVYNYESVLPRPDSITDPHGNVHKMEYDRHDRVVKDFQPRKAGQVPPFTEFVFDPSGNLEKRIAPNGDTTTFVYDKLHRLHQEKITVDNNTLVRTYWHDASGNLVLQKDRRGATIGYQYDDVNQAFREQWDYPNGETAKVFQFQYNVDGSMRTATDTSGISAYEFDYDKLGRTNLIESDLSIGDQEFIIDFDYAYDAAGRRDKRMVYKDGLSLFLTDYTFDAHDRLDWISQTGPAVSNKSVDYIYKPFNAPETSTTKDGRGALSEIKRYYQTETDETVAAPRTTFTYRDSNKRLWTSQHLQGSSTIRTNRINYDDANRVEETWTQTDGTAGTWDVTPYGYDFKNQVTSAGENEIYYYDANGNRPTSPGSFNRIEEDLFAKYKYDAEGNVTHRWDYYEAIGAKVEANTVFEPTSTIIDKAFFDSHAETIRKGAYRFRLEPVLITSPVPLGVVNVTLEVIDNSHSVDSFSYGTTLVKNPVTSTDGKTRYLTDPIDVTFEWPDEWPDSIDQARVRVLFELGSGSPIEFVEFESRAHLLLLDNLYSYYWNHRNQLVGVYEERTPDAGSLTWTDEAFDGHTWDEAVVFVYDVLGNRRAKLVDHNPDPDNLVSDEREFYIAEYGQTLLEFSSEDDLTRSYFYAPGGMALAMDAESQIAWMLTDHNGTVTDLYNAGATQHVVHLKQDPFGVPLGADDEPYEIKLRFRGMEWDTDLGLYFASGRPYDPEAGRFLNTHVAAERTGVNPYAFAGNSPVDRSASGSPDALVGNHISMMQDYIEFGHSVLDAIGVVDPTGIADAINGVWYLSEGRGFEAGLSFVGAFAPYAGDLAKLGRGAAKAADVAIATERASSSFRLGRAAT